MSFLICLASGLHFKCDSWFSVWKLFPDASLFLLEEDDKLCLGRPASLDCATLLLLGRTASSLKRGAYPALLPWSLELKKTQVYQVPGPGVYSFS